ncbi:exopolysaccharide biosynthesis polyprenyl glycosylphosphotransferase [Candidatus Uhrbacteria bacterium]|nr:exopolysaccharide biosynthesis polyprenyl glycosylphosphotransferase [Candidatus Uhrbacteria bacterium]
MGNYRTTKIILLCGDVVWYYAALFLALVLRNGEAPSFIVWNDHAFIYSIALPLWVVVFYISDLYHPSFIAKRGIFATRVFIVMGIIMAISAIVFYILALPNTTPKTVLFMHGGIFTFFFFGWRSIMTKKMLHEKKIPALFIGDREHFLLLWQKIQASTGSEYQLIGYTDPGKADAQCEDMSLTVKSSQEKVADRVIEALIVQDDFLNKTFLLFQTFLTRSGDMQTFSAFFEDQFQELLLEPHAGIETLESIDLGRWKIYDRVKRYVDIVVASIILFIGGSVALPVMIIVKLCSRKPIFYSQKRCTKDGKVFTLYKFRTMAPDAEKEGPVWAKKNDSRATRVGRLLRHTHIDEFPQVWNVLRGELSFVGPRPERPDFVKLLEDAIPYYALRHRITPGISGWAQINFPYAASIEDARRKLSYDLYYLKHRSFTLDLKIFLKTIAFVIKGEGG